MTVAGRRRAVLAVGFLLAGLGARPARGQVPTRPAPVSPDTITRRDTTRRDTTFIQPIPQRDSTGALRRGLPSDTTRRKRQLLWDQEDSVMMALMKRRGYAVTRYQGANVVFHANSHELFLRGKPSMVSRDSATLVGDTIRYNDSSEVVVATGDTLLLRDPTMGDDDVIGLRVMRYDVKGREGIVHDVTTSIQSGQVWIVHGNVGAFQGDTTAGGESAFYARGGTLTSCTLPNPHYHFSAKELKFVTKNVMVARPAVLYIEDIPVMWFPFVFQDVRSGRHSGIIAPRIGFSDIIRNSPSYRRTIDDFGYYFAISDYVDASVTMDWRSDAGSTLSDPGWLKLNGMVRYRVRNLFMNGELGVSYHGLRNGETDKQYSFVHDQQFSQRTNLHIQFNYVTNTTVQRNTTFNPYQAVQNIQSQMNFHTGRGPFSLSLGGTQSQYPGRTELDRTFPTIGITSRPVNVGSWLTWTPSFNSSTTEQLHIDQAGDFAYRYSVQPNGLLDSTRIDRSTHQSTMHFDTPLQIFGFDWRNTFDLSDALNAFPSRVTVYDPSDTSARDLRVYKRTFLTKLDWQTSFNLPSLLQGTWNLTPSAQIQKVDGASGLLVRSELSGGRWVAQPLRPVFGIGISPTFYRQFPGFGPIERIRHSIQAQLSFNYAPAANVSDEFLAAMGDRRAGYLAGDKQNVVTLHLNTVFEAKLRRSHADSVAAPPTPGTPATPPTPPENNLAQPGQPPGIGQSPSQSGVSQLAPPPPLSSPDTKIKLLSLDFSPLSYDFERARVTKTTGLTNTEFNYTARSDLLPGFDFGAGYSLFQGDPRSDTATFKPFLDQVRGTLSLGASSPLVRGLSRLLGFGPSGTAAPIGAQPQGLPVTPPSFVAGQPIAGSVDRAAATSVPAGQGWQLNLTYSESKQRPPRGSNVIIEDPTAICAPVLIDPIAYQNCITQHNPTSQDGNPYNQTTRGGTFFQTPPQKNVSSTLSFHITDKWAAQWQTNYDLVKSEFASQIVSLQRAMHDWDAIFAFTRAPNGNFAFNFYIALKAEPDIKFNYDKRDYPQGYTGVQQP